METSLLSVSFALPIELRAVRHIYEQVNCFLKPETYDSAVYYDLQRVTPLFGATRRLTVRAMDGAAERGRVDIVQWLIDNRAEGCSAKALTGAAANGHIGVVRLLWGSYMNRSYPGDALVSAARNGHEEVVVFLLDKCSLIMKALALAAAAANDHLPVVRVLPTDELGMGSDKAICEAASRGHVEVIAFFFEKSERIKGIYAAEVLQKAICRGHIRLTQYVLDSKTGVLVDALTFAATTGRLDMLRLLLKRANQTQLCRVLLGSSRKGQVNAVEILVRTIEHSGCNEVRMKGYFGDALANAAKENRVELVKLFVTKASVASVERVMIQATVSGFAPVVKVLLETGVCSKWHINHALVVASEHGWVEVVSTLLATCTKDFSYEPNDYSGLDAIRTSLVKAVMYDHTEVVLRVLSKYQSFSDEVAQEFRGVGDRLVQPIDATSIRKLIKAAGSDGCPSILKLLPRKKNDPHYHDSGLKKVRAGEYANAVQWL